MKLQTSLKDDNVVLITPLIDIMFLILIFFVLNTSFSRNSSVDVEVPQAASGVVSQESEFYISISHDHRVFINEDEVELSKFTSKLLTYIGDFSEPNIIIEGDKSISYEFLMEIMDRVRILGFENISLVVSRK